jgi:hypothetical protein
MPRRFVSSALHAISFTSIPSNGSSTTPPALLVCAALIHPRTFKNTTSQLDLLIPYTTRAAYRYTSQLTDSGVSEYAAAAGATSDVSPGVGFVDP